MNHISVGKQIGIYIKKHFRIFCNEHGWNFIIFGAIISLVVCSVVGPDMFDSYEDTKSGFFSIICASIWIGIFNSIQSICKERDILQYEYRSGLKISSYVMSHLIYQALICFIQMIILMIMYCVFVDFPEDGLLLPFSLLEYAITIYLVMLSSDAMGICISSLVKNPATAMTTMPFILILQLVMSGVLFDLEGIVEIIACITISKWGMEAVGSIGNLNDPDLPLRITLENPSIALERDAASAYKYTEGHLLAVWGILVLFIIILSIISVIRLKFIGHENN